MKLLRKVFGLFWMVMVLFWSYALYEDIVVGNSRFSTAVDLALLIYCAFNLVGFLQDLE